MNILIIVAIMMNLSEIEIEKIKLEQYNTILLIEQEKTKQKPFNHHNMGQIKKKKQSIPKKLKTIVWETYIGNNIGQTKCLCCHKTNITMAVFDCGHVISEANGGALCVENLRPICRECNLSMGTKSISEFQKLCGFIEPQIGQPQALIGCINESKNIVSDFDQNDLSIIAMKMDKSFSINDLKKILDILNIKYLKKSHKSDLINQILDNGDQFREIIQFQNNKIIINKYFNNPNQMIHERYKLWNVFSTDMLKNISNDNYLCDSADRFKLIDQLMIYNPKKIILNKLKTDKHFFNQNQLNKIADIIGIFHRQKNIDIKIIEVLELSTNKCNVLANVLIILSSWFKYILTQIYWLYIIVIN